MAPLDDTIPANRFDSFNVYKTSYKQVGDHKIDVGILIPKDIKPGKHPLMVKFHGGGLITGDCLYPDWFAAFFVPFIHRNSAIAILPNYRLLPESSGVDIAEDLTDLWKWVHNGGLASYLSTKNASVQIDFDHVLVSGESAGGYMALMSALTQPKGSLRGVVAQYPMTNYLRREPSDMYFGFPSPKYEELEEHLKSMKPGEVVSSATPPARGGLTYVMAAYKRFLEFFGENPKLWPVNLIEEADYLPPTFIIHGDADTAVDFTDTKLFVEKCEKKGFGANVRLAVGPGGEHGFDGASKEDEEPWLKEGLAWTEKYWLG